MNTILSHCCLSFKSTNKLPFVLIIGVFAAIVIISLLYIVSYAATTLTIIQEKENPTKPLKTFIYVGETLDFDVKLNGEALGGGLSACTWSVSNASLAAVNDLGEVTAKAKGDITVTVKYTSGKNTATATAKLKIKQKVTSVDLSKSVLSLNVGYADKVTATANPSGANDVGNGISLSSSAPSVATVDSKGNIYGLKGGSAVITATFINYGVLTSVTGNTKDEYVTASCYVTVSKITPTGILLNYTERYMYVGESVQLRATVQPANATIKDVKWTSSDPLKATVDDTGKVTSVTEGAVTITCRTEDGGLSASCNIEMEYIDLSKIILDSNEVFAKVGRQSQLKAVYSPAEVTWEISDPEIIEISTSGALNSICEISGLKKGDAVITASSINSEGSTASSCIVKVRNIAPEDLTMKSNEKTLHVGDTYDLDVTVKPADTTAPNIVYESSDPKIATVDQAGTVTAKKNNVNKDTGEVIGDCIITATIESEDEYGEPVRYFANCELTVLNVQPAAISLNKTNIQMSIADAPVQLVPDVQPSNTTIKEVAFISSNEAVASVDENGLVTPISGGTSTITVISKEDENISAECEVTVSPAYSDGIVVKEDYIIVGIEHSEYIQVLSAPGKVTFESSDNSIATVDKNGYVKGVRKGNVDVLLKSENANTGETVTKKVSIRVIRYVEQIILDKEEFVLNTPGGTLAVNAEVYPEDADIKTLAWRSSNDQIATVDKNGVISPAGYGSALITATATDGSEVNATVNIDVAIPVSGIELKPDIHSTTLYIDGAKRGSITLAASVLPASATHKEIKWAASGDGVSLKPYGDNDSFCEITARKQSEDVVITASDYRGIKSATFHVRVKVKVTSVQIELIPADGYEDGNPINVVNTKANNFSLRAKIFPADATDGSVTWESLSANVSIDANGKLSIPKNVSTGTASIRVTTSDGGLSATKQIKINQGMKSILIRHEREDFAYWAQHSVMEGQSAFLIAEAFPVSAYNKDVTVTSSNEAIITVEYPYQGNRIKVSSANGAYPFNVPATIIAVAKDGSGVKTGYEMWVTAPLD